MLVGPGAPELERAMFDPERSDVTDGDVADGVAGEACCDDTDAAGEPSGCAARRDTTRIEDCRWVSMRVSDEPKSVQSGRGRRGGTTEPCDRPNDSRDGLDVVTFGVVATVDEVVAVAWRDAMARRATMGREFVFETDCEPTTAARRATSRC